MKNGDQYPTLAVTQAGRTFLGRRDSLTLTRPKRSSEVVSASKVTDLEYDQTLFEQLRSLRKKFAIERRVPSYIIFGDAALQEMAFYLPQGHESFARINGVGAQKLAQFSDQFLAVIRDHARENGLTERPIPTRRMERDRPARGMGSTYEETKKLLLQKLSISAIAERRGFSDGTIIGHLAHLVGAGEKLDIDHLMPQAERFAKIKTAFQNSGSLTFLTPVRDLLGEEYSNEELRLVRIHLRQAQ